ncbi:MAG: hypothetical protein ACR2OZ_04755 [Verrucomicrobiales bacterium]
MATHDYVAVAADDWYQRRRQDVEGEFFRAVANQSPKQGGADGTDTRQGIYILTSPGKLLAYKNAGQNVEAIRGLLQEGLKKWRALPEPERRPGAVEIGPPGSIDEGYVREAPPGGIIVNVYARALDRTGGSGAYADATCKLGAGNEASLDHLWLTEAEWRSLLPRTAKEGERMPLPAAVAQRILRFHLVDHTRGEPEFWRREHIRRNELHVSVERKNEAGIDLLLEGSVLIQTSDNSRGYDASVSGKIRYSTHDDRITRFDVVAVGDHWGAGNFTRRHQRPGRQPLGFAFELAAAGPATAVAPQGARTVRDYFGQE